VSDHDVAVKLYVDENSLYTVSKTGVTMLGDLHTNGYRITGLTTCES